MEYKDPTSAAFALRRHGDVVSGRWMVGFKVASPGATAGYTAMSNGEGGESFVGGAGVGTPLRPMNKSIMRVKEVSTGGAASKEEYAWEEVEGGGGVTGRIADWLVSRILTRSDAGDGS